MLVLHWVQLGHLGLGICLQICHIILNDDIEVNHIQPLYCHSTYKGKATNNYQTLVDKTLLDLNLGFEFLGLVESCNSNYEHAC